MSCREENVGSLVCGIDIVETKRISKAVCLLGEAFLRRVFTASEVSQARGNHAILSGIFAAKEAVSKAFGCGLADAGGAILAQDLEVVFEKPGSVRLVCSGEAANRAVRMGIKVWHLSISAHEDIAVAFVVGEG